MTGFARQEGGDGKLSWTWEVKSVNGRARDVRCRLPQGYDALDFAARELVAKKFARGNLQLNLSLDSSAVAKVVELNRELLDRIIEVTRELGDHVAAEPPRLDGLLSIPGVLVNADEAQSPELRESRQAAMVADLEAALGALAEARRLEGERLGAVIEGHIERLESLVVAASESAAAQPENLRARLRGQVEELLEAVPALPEERLAQEAAVLITKADVREELDRLRAHIKAVRDLLSGGGAVGRRLDFLCQELNREANTLCAKSPDVDLTQIGLDLKNAVEQLREQVQNIE
ncbi:MAG: YicC family protein [Kiloniellales bacterium]|nr:YicC family protein [Kiloniellales bacterium]